MATHPTGASSSDRDGRGPASPVPLDLYLVTDRRMCAARGVPATVEAAVVGGVTMVQVRDPAATDRELYELVGALVVQLHGSGVPLVVDDRADIALAAGADGVHVGQSDIPARAVRAMGGTGLLIGMTVSRPDQLDEVQAWPAGTVDYLGVGPVYATTTKATESAPIGTDGLRAVVAASPVPCVAIGGIDAEVVSAVMATGVGGVAVVSAICAASDPTAAARRLRQAVGR